MSELIYRPAIKKEEWKVKCDTSVQNCVRDPCPCKTSSEAVLKKHRLRNWEDDQVIRDAVQQHTLFTWGASDPYFDNSFFVKSAQGIYFTTAEGKTYIDFNSQAMCSNLGHCNPKIAKAVYEQMQQVEYVYPCMGYTAAKGKLSALLAELLPGDINTFFYPSTGAEANEAAIRIVRGFTGKEKIIARYRSYHGGTSGTQTLTGDPRRWFRPHAPGIVHAMGPYPYGFGWGNTEEEITKHNLDYMEEVIMQEGPQSIAAIFIEAVTGTNGVLPPPKGYLEGIRKLCDKYDILLVCDEVMSGFGRTGRWFGFCHSEGVVPDVVTMAKGINGAHLPLGCVGVRDKVAAHFKKHPLGTGSTYNSHPVALASAYAALQVMLEDRIVENAEAMGKIMTEEMTRLRKKHPSLKHARNVGLFGMMDIQKNTKTGEFIAPYNAPTLPPAMVQLRKYLLDNGLWTQIRWSSIFCKPPLVITEAELRKAFSIIDGALDITDKALEA